MDIDKQDAWDLRFMRMALFEVATWSKDPNEKVGCVIVSPDTKNIVTGYNGFPKNIENSPNRLNNRDLKNELTVHAELNALLKASYDLTGWVLYTTKPPCFECAKAIIQRDIGRVVCPLLDPESKWFNVQIRAQNLLKEAGIKSTVKDFGIYLTWT